MFIILVAGLNGSMKTNFEIRNRLDIIVVMLLHWPLAIRPPCSACKFRSHILAVWGTFGMSNIENKFWAALGT